ncbi:MAG: hypothetical protein R3C15_04140 [Thermoleophilia bacterium]
MASLTLEHALEALLRGESDACLACGGHVEPLPDGNLACTACGSTLEVGSDWRTDGESDQLQLV